MPRVTEPMSAELLASPGLPEAQGPVLPGMPPPPLPRLASAALRDKPGAPEALTQLHLSSSRWAAALLRLPFHFSSHWRWLLGPLRAEKSLLSGAQVCSAQDACWEHPGDSLKDWEGSLPPFVPSDWL